MVFETLFPQSVVGFIEGSYEEDTLKYVAIQVLPREEEPGLFTGFSPGAVSSSLISLLPLRAVRKP